MLMFCTSYYTVPMNYMKCVYASIYVCVCAYVCIRLHVRVYVCTRAFSSVLRVYGMYTGLSLSQYLYLPLRVIHVYVSLCVNVCATRVRVGSVVCKFIVCLTPCTQSKGNN